MKSKLIATVVLTAAALSLHAELKLATVDLMALVRNHPNYESNKAYLSEKDKDYQKKLDAIKAEGEALQADGRKQAEQFNNPMLNDKAKAELNKKLGDIQQKLVQIEQRYRAEALRCRQELQDDEARLLKTTTDDLRKRLAKFAEEKGYDFILDRNAAPYAKEAFDVTDGVLQSMGIDPAKAKGKDKDEGK